MKEKMDKLDCIKINNFCSVKTTERQSIDWRKYLQNMSDIALECKIYKEILKSDNK